MWPVAFRLRSKTRYFAFPESFDSAALKSMICRDFNIAANSEITISLPFRDYLTSRDMSNLTSASSADGQPVVMPLCTSMVIGRIGLVYDLCVHPPPHLIHPSSSSSSASSATAAESEEKEKAPTDSKKSLAKWSVLALFDYEARMVTELSFKRGDQILVEGQHDKDWWRGSCGDQAGFFPAGYVSGLERISSDPEFWKTHTAEPQQTQFQDPEYFDSYATLHIHHKMLSDDNRTLAYQRAVEKLKPYVQGKIVLDVGCGSGILSMFCAIAGAAHVYAVDASKIIDIAARKVVEANHFEDRITLIKGKIEDLVLPVTEVDCIISEWMGTLMVAESMVDSVLLARQKYLKPGGLMMPHTAKEFLAPLCMDEYYDDKIAFWTNVYGVDMSCLTDLAKEHFFNQPEYLRDLTPGDIMTDSPQCVWDLDMATATSADLESHTGEFSMVLNKTGNMHGFGAWFDVYFTDPNYKTPDGYPLDHTPYRAENYKKQKPVSATQSSNEAKEISNVEEAKEKSNEEATKEEVSVHVQASGEPNPTSELDEDQYAGNLVVPLSTSPWHKPTHWKQVMFVFGTPLKVKKGDTVTGSFTITRDAQWRRHYTQSLTYQLVPVDGSTPEPAKTIQFNFWKG